METLNILLLEDNPADILLAKHAFERVSIENNLHTINNGEDALNYLSKLGDCEKVIIPDIIIMDLNLPKVDGFEILKFIKQSNLIKRIPVIILSGSKAKQDIVNCYDLHANCYVVKPHDFDQLVEFAYLINNFWFSMVKLPEKNINK